MKYLILMIGIAGLLSSCETSNELDSTQTLTEDDYIIFGHFYGECLGDDCIATYKLTSTNLFEDSRDDYNNASFEFEEMDDEAFNEAKELLNHLPNQLTEQEDQNFGCPDCTDQGGIFIELSQDDNIQRWRIDNDESSIPSYLHNFKDEVHETISRIIE